jgi:MFS family permease
MTVLGIGMAGLYTAALYLINKYAEVNHRGYITGLANIFSVAGIFVCAVCGGYLIDEWNDVAPFTVFGLFSLLACFILLFAYFKNASDIRRQKKLIE